MDRVKSNEPSRPASIRINRTDLARILETYRARRNESQEDVATRGDELLRQRRAIGKMDKFSEGFLTGKVTSLEISNGRTLEGTFDDLDLLAAAYQIPGLMLDSLTAEPSEEHCVKQSLNSLVPFNRNGIADYGLGARYMGPSQRLKIADDVALVYLELEAGESYTHSHAHPGDELIFVLDGEIEVPLFDSGMWNRLEKWDYLHFYSEQEHSARNNGTSVAKAFIIRFYQLGTGGTRYKFLEQLRGKKKQRRPSERAIREMIASLRPPDLRPPCEPPTEISDRIGLGRLLQLVCSGEYRKPQKALSLSTLETLSISNGFSADRNRLDRIHHGESPITIKELEAIADLYEIEGMLLYDYAYPTRRNAVAVRKDDYRSVPSQFVSAEGARYSVPCRRLADSDISISRVVLDSGAWTPLNRHPGHELIVPLRGQVEVKTGSLRTGHVTADEDLFTHYQSSVPHRVGNEGNETAELLLFRFY